MVYRLGFTDAELRSAYTDATGIVSEAEFDRGARSLGYTLTVSRALSASGDQIIASSELFEALSTRSSLRSAYQRFASEPLPWIATSGTVTQNLLTQFDAMVSSWRRSHSSESPTGEAMARAIYDWVISTSGMGMVNDPNARELNIEQIATQLRGDCTEFAKLFLCLMSRAGFTVHPYWVQVDLNGNEAVHIVAGVEIGGRTIFLDPVYNRFNPAHQTVSRLSLREFLAWHWNNRAMEAQRSNQAEGVRLFTRALQIDPGNPHFLTNRAMLRMRRASRMESEARELEGEERRTRRAAARAERASGIIDYQDALRSVSNFHYANFQLGNLEYDADRFGTAATYYRSALTASPGNESYARNLILALYSDGQRRSARRELGRLIARHPAQADLLRLVGDPIPES